MLWFAGREGEEEDGGGHEEKDRVHGVLLE
jgi:hypothetical protein